MINIGVMPCSTPKKNESIKLTKVVSKKNCVFLSEQLASQIDHWN